MAFLASILPSIGKFGTNVIKDIVQGKNIGQSLKNRGMDTIRNLPVVGPLVEPLIEKVGDDIYQKITHGAKTKKGKKRQRAIRKIFGGRLTPAGQEMAKVMAKALTGKDAVTALQEGGDVKDIIKESIKGAKAKKGKLTGEDITDIIKIAGNMKKRKGKKKKTK